MTATDPTTTTSADGVEGTASGTGTTGEDLLLDRWLPHDDETVREHRVVDARPATTWQALQALDLMQVHTPLLDAAMYARGLPSALGTRLGRRPPAAAPPELLLLNGEGSEEHRAGPEQPRVAHAQR